MRNLLLITTVLFLSTTHGHNSCPKRVQLPINLCPETVKPNSKYRPIDGKLNNRCLNSGQSFKPYDRLKSAAYDDCLWKFRKTAVSGEELPPPRYITNGIVREFTRTVPPNFKTPNLLSVMFGQFIAHDIGSLMETVSPTTRCCTAGSVKPLPVEEMPEICMPLAYPADDPDLQQVPNIRCLVFGHRSVRDTSYINDSYPADQQSRVTQFLDNSNLYGSTREQMEELREGHGGRMITNSENILPETVGGRFFLGDSRLNQSPQLALLHSIYLREHNRIAAILEELNAHWNDTRLFEETRRIVIAQYQHIVFEEWMPKYISRELLHLLDDPLDGAAGIFLESSTYTEFNHAIFRLFHSYLPQQIQLIAQDGSVTLSSIHEMTRSGIRLTSQLYDDIARGLLLQPMNTGKFDHMLRQLLSPVGQTIGMDLIAVDILRGRDHGVPPYLDILKYFSPIKAGTGNNFDDLKPFISAGNLQLLRDNYESVWDVDLFVGAMLEEPLGDALLGPTAQLMLVRQFWRLKASDPYFYTNHISPNPFSSAQLLEIRKATTNHLFCDNSAVEWVPKDASLAPTSIGFLESCDSLAEISYASWKESR